MPISEVLLNMIKQNNPEMTQIDLSRKSLNDDDIVLLSLALSLNIYIKEINLSYNFISNIGANYLVRFTKLTSLILTSNNITYVSLDHNKTLTSLDLRYNKIEFVIISKAHGTNTTLKNLQLAYNKMNCAGAYLLSLSTSLKILNLKNNLIRDAGATYLFKNKTITDLNLSNNAIRCISEEISSNTALLSLTMTDTKITHKSAEMKLIKPIFENKILTYFNLFHNKKHTRITSTSLSFIQNNRSNYVKSFCLLALKCKEKANLDVLLLILSYLPHKDVGTRVAHRVMNSEQPEILEPKIKRRKTSITA